MSIIKPFESTRMARALPDKTDTQCALFTGVHCIKYDCFFFCLHRVALAMYNNDIVIFHSFSVCLISVRKYSAFRARLISHLLITENHWMWAIRFYWLTERFKIKLMQPGYSAQFVFDAEPRHKKKSDLFRKRKAHQLNTIDTLEEY